MTPLPLLALSLSFVSLLLIYSRRYAPRGYRYHSHLTSRVVSNAIDCPLDLLPDKTIASAICAALSPVAGLCKVRAFLLEASSSNAVLFALIYLPDGIDPTVTNLRLSTAQTTSSLCPPAQRVILSGTTNPGALAVLSAQSIRALASGDGIDLLAGNIGNAGPGV
jgi:hypothetical protein